jgi:hypothetical protein
MKGKIKLPLWMSLRHVGGGVEICLYSFLTLSHLLRRAVSFEPRPSYSRYTLNGRLDGPHNRSGWNGTRKAHLQDPVSCTWTAAAGLGVSDSFRNTDWHTLCRKTVRHSANNLNTHTHTHTIPNPAQTAVPIESLKVAYLIREGAKTARQPTTSSVGVPLSTRLR